MTKAISTTVAVLLAGLWAETSFAQCSFDTGRAKGLKGSMVRIYAACPSTDNPTGNTQTEGGTTACTPVTPAGIDGVATLFTYGPKGACSVSFSGKVEADCADLEDDQGDLLGLGSGPCHVMSVKSKCKGILRPNGVDPIDAADDGFTLVAIIRATLDDPVNGDMTVVDLPLSFSFDIPRRGSMKLRGNSAEALIPGFGLLNAALPPCTSIEFESITIKDPAGLPFATLGGATVSP